MCALSMYTPRLSFTESPPEMRIGEATRLQLTLTNFMDTGVVMYVVSLFLECVCVYVAFYLVCVRAREVMSVCVADVNAHMDAHVIYIYI